MHVLEEEREERMHLRDRGPDGKLWGWGGRQGRQGGLH